jgi:predicted dehydrogenase
MAVKADTSGKLRNLSNGKGNTGDMTRVLRAAIVGMGGFARSHHQALRELEASGQVRLVATCDPHPQRFASEQEEWDFAERGVRVYPDFSEMLEAHTSELDFVTLPTPIPLHAPMHRACVERGLACYLEKPPTLWWAELDVMLAVEENARSATQVGFNFIAEKPRQELKQRLLAGEFGRLRRAGFLGYWPRPKTYFTRAPWAGQLVQGEQLVLDSCTGNAMAHFIHNLLFWCGQDEVLSWGQVGEVEAELYRAHDIESFDTCFARGHCAEDIEIAVAVTHAGSGDAHHHEWIECQDAEIIYRTGHEYSVRWNDGRTETGIAERGTLLAENLRHYVRYLNGAEARPLTTLADSRPFVHFNNLLFIASGHISTISPDHLQGAAARGEEWLEIEGIEAVMNEFTRDVRLPSETNRAWGRSGGHATIEDLKQLENVVRRMKAEKDEC